MTVDAIAALGISKRYGGVQALNDVSFRVRPGEVRALLGANGAGKSTLINVLSGAVTPEAGQVAVAGKTLTLGDVRAAKRAGVTVVHQELMLFPDLTVEENIAASRLPLNRIGLLDRAARRSRVASLLSGLGLAVPPSRRVRELSLAQQQIVEIARAMFGGGRVLVLDEPTSALSQPETDALLGVVRELARREVAVVFVSHRLGEAMAIADEITVLRDGQVRGTWATNAVDVAAVTRAMVGEIAPAPRPSKTDQTTVVLSLRDVVNGDLGPISIDLHAGEITGLIGLEGAGTDRLLRVLGGALPAAGQILLHGRRLSLRHPADALRAGLVYMPADRKLEGLWLDRSPIWNIAPATIRRTRVCSWPGWPALRRDGLTHLAAVGVRLSGAEEPTQRLSGGNQQRVLFARALSQQPAVLLLSDPSRGVDIRAKAAIHTLITGLAAQGMAICIAGTDIDEILTLATYVVCMHGGQIAAAGTRGAFSAMQVMEHISGHAPVQRNDSAGRTGCQIRDGAPA